MTYTLKIRRAIRFSVKTHEVYQKQKRKGKDIAYITHPLTVGIILAAAGAHEDVIVAGILHDTIEDSVAKKKVTPAMVKERFGARVAKLVVLVTEEDRTASWEERKDEAHARISKFSHDAVLVKSADVISNGTELLDDYGRDGVIVFSRFSAPKEKVMMHHHRVIAALLEQWSKNPLASDLRELDKNLRLVEADYKKRK